MDWIKPIKAVCHKIIYILIALDLFPMITLFLKQLWLFLQIKHLQRVNKELESLQEPKMNGLKQEIVLLNKENSKLRNKLKVLNCSYFILLNWNLRNQKHYFLDLLFALRYLLYIWNEPIFFPAILQDFSLWFGKFNTIFVLRHECMVPIYSGTTNLLA